MHNSNAKGNLYQGYLEQHEEWMRLMVDVHKLSFVLGDEKIFSLPLSNWIKFLPQKDYQSIYFIYTCKYYIVFCELWCCQYIAVIYENEKCWDPVKFLYHFTSPLCTSINLPYESAKSH